MICKSGNCIFAALYHRTALRQALNLLPYEISLFLVLLPLAAKAQFFEPFDKWGVRTAYTHTNGSRDFGFVGASLNSIAVDRSGLAAMGAKVYAGTHIGKPDH